MVYSIFSLYQLDTREYKIKDIILSGGDTIELDNDSNSNNNALIETIGKNLGDVAGNAASSLGENIVTHFAEKEAAKKIVEKSVKTMTLTSIKYGTIRASANTIEESFKQATKITITNSLEKMAIDSSKGLIKQGIQEGTKMAIQATKETAIVVSKNGAETVIEYGSRASIQSVTESIVITQGGRAWLINLGKAVPFIGAAINAITNIISTAKMGHKLVTKLDEEFENNQQRKVDILKGKILGIYNIIEQLEHLIEIHGN